MPTLSQIWHYPVKSCRGVSHTTLDLTDTGLQHDRQWMLVHTDHHRMVTQRSHPRLALIETRIQNDTLILTWPNQAPIHLPLIWFDTRTDMTSVTVWHDTVQGASAEQTIQQQLGFSVDQALSTFLDCPVQLVKFASNQIRLSDQTYAQPQDHTAFADGFPLLLIGQASLDDLNQRLQAEGHDSVPMNRFRPNLVIEGTAPYEEDQWQRIQIGQLTFRLCKPCARCGIVTVDQETAEVNRQPLSLLNAYRQLKPGKPLFGQNVLLDQTGDLHTGMAVTVLETIT